MAIELVDVSKLMMEFATALKSLDSKEQMHVLLKAVLAGSGHTDLTKFHQDSAIGVGIKIARYTQALTTIQCMNAGLGTTLKVPDKIIPASPHSTNSELSSLRKTVDKLTFDINNLRALFGKEEQEHKLAKDRLTVLEESIQNKRIEGLKIYSDKHPDGIYVDCELVHKQAPEILSMLLTRNAFGWTEFVYIHGAPGAGKTHLAKWLAKQIRLALGLTEDEFKCYTYPMGPSITEGKMLGFNNLVNGNFVKGWLYEGYKHGGLVAIDEIDLADASVLGSTNSIENDEFCFGNGEFVRRHKNFFLIAFANTAGTGSKNGFVRNVLDAATRDRFTFYELFYDEELERRIFGNPEWANWVQKVRDYVKNSMSGGVYVTSRSIRKGAAYLLNNHPWERVADWTVFKGFSVDQKRACLATVGDFKWKFKKIMTPEEVKMTPAEKMMVDPIDTSKELYEAAFDKYAAKIEEGHKILESFDPDVDTQKNPAEDIKSKWAQIVNAALMGTTFNEYIKKTVRKSVPIEFPSNKFDWFKHARDIALFVEEQMQKDVADNVSTPEDAAKYYASLNHLVNSLEKQTKAK